MKKLILALLILAGTVHAQSLIVISGSKTVSAAPTASFISGGSCQNNGTNCTSTIAHAGDAIAGCASWSVSGTPASISVSDGTNSFTILTHVSDTQNDWVQCFYLLNETLTGSTTFTVTFPGGASSLGVWEAEFHATSGTWHYDTSNQAGQHNTTASNSGTITSHGSTGEIIVNEASLANTAATYGSPAIGGNTPTEMPFSPVNTYTHDYYLLNTSVSSGATGTYSTNTDWTNSVVALYAQ